MTVSEGRGVVRELASFRDFGVRCRGVTEEGEGERSGTVTAHIDGWLLLAQRVLRARHVARAESRAPGVRWLRFAEMSLRGGGRWCLVTFGGACRDDGGEGS